MGRSSRPSRLRGEIRIRNPYPDRALRPADRIHVLEGRLIVLLNVDKVVKIIRNADDLSITGITRAFWCS